MRHWINLFEDYASNLSRWFKGSVITNEDGDPMVVHHFTHSEVIDVFDRLWAANYFKRDPESIDTVGLWFTNKEVPYGPNRMDCYLRMTKPYWLDDQQDGTQKDAWMILFERITEAGGSTAFRTKLKASGYDGIIMQETLLDGREQTVMIVLEPGQIKSVENGGRFDSENDDIRESE
jgi:hypothetical protein